MNSLNAYRLSGHHIEVSQNISSIPVSYTTDVLVGGGGFAGVTAALAAARQGVNVTLIESENCLGGEAGKGLVGGTENIFYNRFGGEFVLPGIPAEIVGAIYGHQFGKVLDWENHNQVFWFVHEPETVKLSLQELCLDAGVNLMFNANIVGVIKDNKTVQGLVVHSKSGSHAICSKITIDCTGDGDIAALADVPFNTIEQESNLVFRVANCDFNKCFHWLEHNKSEMIRGSKEQTDVEFSVLKNNFERGYFFVRDSSGDVLPGPVGRAKKDKRFEASHFGVPMLDRLGIQGLVETGSAQINTGYFRLAFDPVSLTKSEISGRKAAYYVVEFLRNYFPGFEKSFISATASRLGRRVSRIVECEREYTKSDLGIKHSDSICWHPGSVYFTSIDHQDKPGAYRNPGWEVGDEKLWGAEKPYRSIPLRCFIANGVNRLLMGSGKSFNFPSLPGHLRGMMETAQLGQSAGALAAAAVSTNSDIATVDPQVVRTIIGQKEGY